jgi:hypothetical protein
MRERAAEYLRKCNWAHDACSGQHISVLAETLSSSPVEEQV